MRDVGRFLLWLLLAILLMITTVRLRGDEPKKEAPRSNIQILKGLTPIELQRTMNSMRGALGVHCDFCHVVTDEKGWQFDSDAKPEKKRAREMIRMVQQLNAATFAGQPRVTCFSCHRGERLPASMLPLPQTPPPFPTPPNATPSLPSLESVRTHYAASLGDPHLLDAPIRYEGNREAFDGKPTPVTLVEAPGGKVLITAMTPEGSVRQALDGSGGWMVTPKESRDLAPPEINRIAENAAAASVVKPEALDAAAQVTGKVTIDGRDHWVVEHPLDATHTERLLFDAESGRLRRKVLLWTTPIGIVPRQTDFIEYRDAGGVVLPYVVKISFVDPWVGSTRKWDTIKVDKGVDDEMFRKPAETKK
jgi:Photosynthetic reaction centre cytochrome C subunit